MHARTYARTRTTYLHYTVFRRGRVHCTLLYTLHLPTLQLCGNAVYDVSFGVCAVHRHTHSTYLHCTFHLWKKALYAVVHTPPTNVYMFVCTYVGWLVAVEWSVAGRINDHKCLDAQRRRSHLAIVNYFNLMCKSAAVQHVYDGSESMLQHIQFR